MSSKSPKIIPGVFGKIDSTKTTLSAAIARFLNNELDAPPVQPTENSSASMVYGLKDDSTTSLPDSLSADSDPLLSFAKQLASQGSAVFRAASATAVEVGDEVDESEPLVAKRS